MMAGMSVADVPVVTRNDDLLDGNLIRRWLAWGFVWLLVFPTVGAVVAAKFNHPDFLGGVAWLSFGRLRPIHVNGVIWGAFSTLFIGLAHYVVPRLCGVRVAGERVGPWLLWIWNVNLAVGVVMLGLGANRGWEAGEFPLATVMVTLGVLLALTVQFLVPIAEWAQTIAIVSSMMLIIPVWTVIQNFFGTVGQRWRGLGSNLPAKFLITGSLMYLVGCFQGSIEALRVLQRPTHFTDFVIGHSHITIFGTFVIWALAGAVYVWPRITASAPWSLALGNGAFWLITAGITAMFVVLVTHGLIQGVMLMRGAEWLHSVNAMRPWWWVRTLTGLARDVGNSLLVLTLTLGSLGARRPVTA